MHAIEIPPTSPQCYISFKHALNLRFPQEDTGEWHFLTAFFDEKDKNRSAPLAGKGKSVNTIPCYKIHYLDPGNSQDMLLKIETSFRQRPKTENIEIVNKMFVLQFFKRVYLMQENQNLFGWES
jgi:hypothetical protein